MEGIGLSIGVGRAGCACARCHEFRHRTGNRHRAEEHRTPPLPSVFQHSHASVKYHSALPRMLAHSLRDRLTAAARNKASRRKITIFIPIITLSNLPPQNRDRGRVTVRAVFDRILARSGPCCSRTAARPSPRRRLQASPRRRRHLKLAAERRIEAAYAPETARKGHVRHRATRICQ